MNSNTYKVPYLENNSYLYGAVELEAKENQKAPEYKDELDYAKPTKDPLIKLFSCKNESQNLSRPLRPLSHKTPPQSTAFKDAKKGPQKTEFLKNPEDFSQKENQPEPTPLNPDYFSSVQQSQKLKQLEKPGNLKSSFEYDTSKALPSFRSDYRDQVKYEPSLLSELERSEKYINFLKYSDGKSVPKSTNYLPSHSSSFSLGSSRQTIESIKTKVKKNSFSIRQSKKLKKSSKKNSEKSGTEKQVFVKLMMKVLQDHAKNCKNLRHEIDKIKFSKLFNM